MTKDDITKAFEGRWRIKGNYGRITQNIATLSSPELYEHIKGMCRNFFEAGFYLGQCSMCEPIPMSAIVKAAEEVAFDDWWTLYDKKCGRKDCEKKWNKLSLEEKEACLAATPAYVASTPDKQYRKNPLSYLNQKAWNDEIIPRNGTDNKSTIEQQRKSKLTDILVG